MNGLPLAAAAFRLNQRYVVGGRIDGLRTLSSRSSISSESWRWRRHACWWQPVKYRLVWSWVLGIKMDIRKRRHESAIMKNKPSADASRYGNVVEETRVPP